MSSLPSIHLGFESIRPGNGGIARVARLMARVFEEEALAGRANFSGTLLSDSEVPESPIRWGTAKGSRAKYLARISLAKWRHSHVVYDCLGMARAHSVFPFPARHALCWLHGIEVWPGSAHAKQVEAGKKLEFLLVNSETTRKRASELTPDFARARVCWLATEEDDIPSPVLTGEAHPPTVMILARMDTEDYKGHKELFAAWPRVLQQVPDAVLIVVGGGPRRGYYQDLASRSAAANRIQFPGFVPDEAMPALWQKTDVFAMPSRGEGFGLVYIEAMRQGIPVIASVHDAGQEVNVDGQTGYNINMDDPDQLTNRLVELLTRRDLAKQMGEAGRDRWREHFCFSAFRQRFLPLWQEFLSR